MSSAEEAQSDCLGRTLPSAEYPEAKEPPTSPAYYSRTFNTHVTQRWQTALRLKYFPKVNDLVWVADGRLVSYRVVTVNRTMKTVDLVLSTASKNALSNVPWSKLQLVPELDTPQKEPEEINPFKA